MAAVPTLTARVWTESDVDALAPALDVAPFGPLAGPVDVFGGAQLHEYRLDRQHGLVATRLVQLQHGRRLDVVGAVSLGDRMDSRNFAATMDAMAMAYGADQLAMCTRRAHLVRAATRHGWTISGMVLTKGFHYVQQ